MPCCATNPRPTLSAVGAHHCQCHTEGLLHESDLGNLRPRLVKYAGLAKILSKSFQPLYFVRPISTKPCLCNTLNARWTFSGLLLISIMMTPTSTSAKLTFSRTA